MRVNPLVFITKDWNCSYIRIHTFAWFYIRYDLEPFWPSCSGAIAPVELYRNSRTLSIHLDIIITLHLIKCGHQLTTSYFLSFRSHVTNGKIGYGKSIYRTLPNISYALDVIQLQ